MLVLAACIFVFIRLGTLAVIFITRDEVIRNNVVIYGWIPLLAIILGVAGCLIGITIWKSLIACGFGVIIGLFFWLQGRGFPYLPLYLAGTLAGFVITFLIQKKSLKTSASK